MVWLGRHVTRFPGALPPSEFYALRAQAPEENGELRGSTPAAAPRRRLTRAAVADTMFGPPATNPDGPEAAKL
jgi:hypothetical protein